MMTLGIVTFHAYKCRYAEFRGWFIILSVIMLSVVVLSVVAPTPCSNKDHVSKKIVNTHLEFLLMNLMIVFKQIWPKYFLTVSRILEYIYQTFYSI